MQQDARTLIAETTRRFLNNPGYTKKSAVRMALSEAMRNGIFNPGDPLPPERELVEICGVSLGTVQAALDQLKQMDLIERRRGSGTRVKPRQNYGEQVWHFRFISKQTGKSMPVLAAKVQISETEDKGGWAGFLGRSSSYIQIRRELQMSEKITVFACMYLHPHTAPTLLNHDPSDLTLVNIRAYLTEKFGLPPSRASHLISTVDASEVPFDKAGEQHLGSWYLITATTTTSDHKPVYYQKIWVPVAVCNLDFGQVHKPSAPSSSGAQ